MADILKLVATPVAYPRNRETVRPFRLWDATARKAMRWRYYSDKRRAHQGALVEARWSKVGACIEVFDARNGKLLGQYTRTLTSIEFMEG